MAKKRRGAPRKPAADKSRHRLVLMLTDEQDLSVRAAAALGGGKRPSAWAREMVLEAAVGRRP